MGAVDQFDQLIHDFTIRTEVINKNRLNWISKPLYICFDMEYLNSYYLHKELSTQTSSRYDFYSNISFGLLKSGTSPNTPTLAPNHVRDRSYDRAYCRQCVRDGASKSSARTSKKCDFCATPACRKHTKSMCAFCEP